jgi:hypothetical protein
MAYIEVKSLAGVSYIRASDVVAVQFSDPQRCSILMVGGTTVLCAESAKDIMARVEAAMAKTAAEPKDRN